MGNLAPEQISQPVQLVEQQPRRVLIKQQAK